MKPGHASELAKLMVALGTGDARQGGPPMRDVAPLCIRRAGQGFPARGWVLTLSPDGVRDPFAALCYCEGGFAEFFWNWYTRGS